MVRTSVEEEVFFGFEIEEEYGLWTGGIEAAGDKIRLCHSVIDARDQIVEKLRYAARPTWIAVWGTSPPTVASPRRRVVLRLSASCQD